MNRPPSIFTIRCSEYCDIPVMQSIFDQARAKMVAMGNTNQWIDGYPQDSVLEHDIRCSNSYVVEWDGQPVATFAWIIGKDPTYQTIYQGQWLDSVHPYGTLHRVASVQGVHGVMDAVLDYAFRQNNNVRIDTHKDNALMRHVLEKSGFHYCGIIHTHNGDDRLAFQKVVH